MQALDLVKPGVVSRDEGGSNEARRQASPPRRMAWAAAGPLLILATVLFVMRGFAFEGRLFGPDIAQFFLPNHCFLGESLRAGHLPAWNPYSMGGVPFAADPQSGWMYLPVMLLYTLLPCEAAMRWFIVLQPALAGVGAYAFLRSERVGRIGSTIAGLGLGIPLGASSLVLSLPFAGTLAWTPVMLACVSRAFAALTWPARIVWIAGAAIAWGQVAAAMLSHGLLVATAALAGYVTFKLLSLARSERLRDSIVVTALLLPVLPVVNLAYLLPRLAYLRRATLGLGYEEMERIAAQMVGAHYQGLDVGAAADPTWVLKLATYPGLYLGGLVLIFSLAAVLTRRHRHLLLAFAFLGALAYLLSLERIAELGFWRSLPLSDFYIHNPARLRLAVLLAVPMLAGVGVNAWTQKTASKHRLAVLLSGVIVWLGLPLALGVPAGHLSMLLLGLVLSGIALIAAGRRRSLLVLLPLVLTIELAALPLTGVGADLPSNPPGLEGPWASPPMWPMSMFEKATTERRGYLQPGSAIAEQLRSLPLGRYLTLRRQAPRETADPLAMMLRLEQVQAYNPIQLRRYWTFVRAVNQRKLKYNVSIFMLPRRIALDLLNVRYVVGRRRASKPHSPFGSFFGRTILADPIAVEDELALWPVKRPSERTEVVDSWAVVSQDEALQTVTSRGFDPHVQVLLEKDPGLPRNDGTRSKGKAVYSSLGLGHVRVRVTTQNPALVLVRTPYDPNWRATVDGRDTEVLAADYVIQAVPVWAGSHIIDLTYLDPTIGYGMAGTALSLALLLGVALLLKLRPTAARGRWAGQVDDGIKTR